MNSYDNLNNFKYLGKIAAITIIVFVILKYAINMRQIEAVLLAAIIAVSILIIENIIFINNEASDPLNCDQCKVQQVENTSSPNISKPTVPNSNENFGMLEDLEKDIKNITTTILNTKENFQNVERVENKKESVEILKDITKDLSTQTKPLENSSSETLDSYIDEQAEKNLALIQDKYIEKTNMPTELPAGYSESTTFQPKPSGQILSNNVQDEKKFKEDIKNEYNALLTNENKDFIDNKIPSMNLNDLTVPNTVTKGDPIKGPSISFDESYVQYQKNGLEKLDQLDALKTNIFRASIGDQEVVQKYLKDGEKYYNSIYSYSTDAPKTYEALNSELKYGDYNYIGPLNKGMINKEYTFISPTNWYPIPPFPPVCVTNKSCTTCPIQMTDGKDYMQFASLEDFDKARRFTGDMRINIDYIKDVLNNPNGY